jgi:hypothetical protein
VDDLAREVRRTNQLLTLVHGPAIASRLQTLSRSNSNNVILSALSSGEEMSTDALVNAGRAAGVGRTTVFLALNELERYGVVERPRRGIVVLSLVARPFLPAVDGRANTGRAEESEDGA